MPGPRMATWHIAEFPAANSMVPSELDDPPPPHSDALCNTPAAVLTFDDSHRQAAVIQHHHIHLILAAALGVVQQLPINAQQVQARQ